MPHLPAEPIPTRLSVMLLGAWSPLSPGSGPIELDGATFWRSAADLRSLNRIAAIAKPAWLLTGEGLDEREVMRIGAAFKQAAPTVRHAVLGPPDDIERCEAWIRRGASVYWGWDAQPAVIVGALACASRYGAVVVDERLQQAGLLMQARMQAALPEGSHGLTARELEVLRLMRKGLRNADIADALVISESTVEAHTHSIYHKLGVTNRTAAIEHSHGLNI